MGTKPKRWCEFHIVKGNHTEDCYQLKNEIERLIQEKNLKKYVKSDSSLLSNNSNLRRREDDGSTKPKKTKEIPNGEGS